MTKRFYVTNSTMRRAHLSGAVFAAALGGAFARGLGRGVKMEREDRIVTEADTLALAAAAEKRSRKAARRTGRDGAA